MPLVVLEDVHWADQATLDVAPRARAAHRRDAGALVLATYRDDEVDGGHPLRVVLGELASRRRSRGSTVPRLSLDAVRELAEPHGADAEAIHRLTHGNAFYVTEVLAAGGDELPGDGRDAVLARTALLDAGGAAAARRRSVVPGARRALAARGGRAGRARRSSTRASTSGVLRARRRRRLPARARPARGRERDVRRTGGGRCTPRSSRALVPTRRLLPGSPTTPRRPATSAAVLELRAARRRGERQRRARTARRRRSTRARSGTPTRLAPAERAELLDAYAERG